MTSQGANKVMECFGVKSKEKVLIVVDTSTPPSIGGSLFEAAKNLGCEAIIITMLPRTRHGEEIPLPIAEAMKNSDVVIAPTTFSLDSYPGKDKCLQSRSKSRLHAGHHRADDGSRRNER